MAKDIYWVDVTSDDTALRNTVRKTCPKDEQNYTKITPNDAQILRAMDYPNELSRIMQNWPKDAEIAPCVRGALVKHMIDLNRKAGRIAELLDGGWMDYKDDEDWEEDEESDSPEVEPQSLGIAAAV